MSIRQDRPTSFRGYQLRSSAQDDGELTRVGPATPGGEYLRRFWQPIALAEEFAELPLAIRVLGEDLVLFRDGRGRVGLLHRQCSHRGVSLEFGQVRERGIRCCYHGWLFDVDGTILETPAEPGSRIGAEVCQGAYPTAEIHGLIFAYLGPPEARPPLPDYDTFHHPHDNRLVAFKLDYACNWLQVHENTADPMHIPFLHGRVSGVQFGVGFSELPGLSFVETPLGLAVASTRVSDGRLWIRTADVMLPNVAQYPPAFETGEATRRLVDAWATRWIVPVDDTHCWVIGFRHFNAALDPQRQGRPEAVGLGSVDFAGQVAAPPGEAQRAPGDYEAMVGQGPIAIRRNEHLITSDRGVVRLRKQLRDGIAAVRDGRPLAHPHHGATPEPTYTAELVVPCAGPLELHELVAVGDCALQSLLESAHEPAARRAERLAECVTLRLAGNVAEIS
jgi:nitrite reductase/ring-hydroxylating ferredoxin subunit